MPAGTTLAAVMNQGENKTQSNNDTNKSKSINNNKSAALARTVTAVTVDGSVPIRCYYVHANELNERLDIASWRVEAEIYAGH